MSVFSHASWGWTVIAMAVLAVVAIWQSISLRRLRTVQREMVAVLDEGLGGTQENGSWPVPRRIWERLPGRVHAAIHALREEREEVLQERSKLEGILSHISSGVLVIDRVGKVVLVNEATERLLGFSQADMIGRWHWEAGRHYGLSSLVDEAMTFGDVQKREVQFHRPHELTIEAHVTPIRQSNGTVSGAVVLLHDVSEWRRVERMRSDFVANVSHELRTPITGLKGFAETLLDGALNDAQTARQFVQIMKDEADRLGRLVEDLLDLSKIEAGHSQLRLTPVRLERVFQKVINTFATRAAEVGVSLICENLESLDYLPSVLADADRLQQVFINLVSNALAFTPSGGKITLAAQVSHGRMILSVEDTGVGIPQQDVARVFERFYRVDKARSRQSGGTGLGLAIVKHLVEAHGGHVGVSSQVGVGSRFFFDVPLCPESSTG